MKIEHMFKYPKNDAEVAANPWVEVTEEYWHEMLGCVPPAARLGVAFAVGEPMNHMDDGRVVHRVVIGPVAGKFYTKPYPLKAFDPAVFAKEIKAQVVSS